eukprot:6173953-Pleurochrysis_carterae.AAC.2
MPCRLHASPGLTKFPLAFEMKYCPPIRSRCAPSLVDQPARKTRSSTLHDRLALAGDAARRAGQAAAAAAERPGRHVAVRAVSGEQAEARKDHGRGVGAPSDDQQAAWAVVRRIFALLSRNSVDARNAVSLRCMHPASSSIRGGSWVGELFRRACIALACATSIQLKAVH